MSNKADVTTMKQATKRELTPKLRFPEFRDAGAWEEKTLDKCLDYQQPTAYLVSDTKYSDAYKTPVLTAGKTFILGYTNEQHGIFSDNLPVIIFDDFTTATQFVDFPFKAKSSAMKILQAKNGANIQFMYEIMQMIAYEVGGHERHWISKFAPMSILIPHPIEQQKIADCLSSIDELVAAQTQKLDTLKTHKKGLMQQLFPAEGETLPKLRFPEFRDAGAWEEKKLSTIAELTSSKRVHLSDYVPNGIPFFRGKEISLLKNNQIPEDILFISEEHYEEIRDKYGVPGIGDILITAVGTLGNVYCIQNSNKFYFKDGNLIWMKNISEDSVFLERRIQL